MILDLVSTCGNRGIATLVYIAKTALTIIQIAGPILAIIGLVLILIKLMSNPENKKLKNAFKNWLIALLMVFFIPIIVNVTMKLLEDSFSIAACWNYAESAKPTGDSNYIPPNNENPQNVVGNPNDYDTGDEKKDDTTSSSQQSSSSSSSSSSSQTSSQTANSSNKLIFVGDSRTVGMKSAVNSNDVWSAKESIGLDWMKSTGIPQIENLISNGSSIIILMGVNDLYKADSYISYINGKAKDWTGKGAKVYFVSVLPTKSSYDSLNSEIDSFNSKMKSNLSSSVKYIDTNSYLKSTGFDSTDGLHYDNATYQKIYNHIKSNL